jgi:hypothetical protein
MTKELCTCICISFFVLTFVEKNFFLEIDSFEIAVKQEII